MLDETIEFKSYDLASSGFVRPSAVLRRMQQVAREDLNRFGISYQDLRDRNMAFVVSRMALVFERPIQGEVPLTLRTAANPTKGATFPRSFAILDGKGVCMRAMSLWALLDFKKRALLRPSSLEEEIPTGPDLSEGVVCERLILPKEEPLFTDTRRVYASMLDQNNHLNNCNYADLATDLYPNGSPEVREMHISFQKEARLGEELVLQGFGSEKELLVSGSFRDRAESCFLCKIKTF